MRTVLAGLGILFIIGGIVAATRIRSDIQLIIVILAFGFALTFFGIGVAIDELVKLRKRIERLAGGEQEPAQELPPDFDMSRWSAADRARYQNRRREPQ